MIIGCLYIVAWVVCIIVAVVLAVALWLWCKDAVNDALDRAFYWVVDKVMGCKGETIQMEGTCRYCKHMSKQAFYAPCKNCKSISGFGQGEDNWEKANEST